MGIENFNEFIKKEAPTAFTEIPATYFKNTVIAIDAHNYIYTNMFISLKQSLRGVNLRDDVSAGHDNDLKIQAFLKQIVRFVINLTSYSITPVFVFDGPNIEGKVVRVKRQENNRKAHANIKKLESELEQQDPLERTDEDIEELRRLKGSVTHINAEEMNLFKDLLTKIGIPIIQADGDGEHICCMLVREGLATAVYSRDTDCMVYGCPIMLKKLKKPSGKRYHVFEVTQFAPILKNLKISYESFVDLCIMAKCDYNTNIPNIAMVKSYKLLKKYKNIETVAEQEGHDIECLNHEFCRDQFRICPAVELLHDDHNGVIPTLKINKDAIKNDDARRILRLYDADDLFNALVASYRNITVIVNRKADELSTEGRIIFTNRRVNIIVKGKPCEPAEPINPVYDEKYDTIDIDDPMAVLQSTNYESYD